MGFCFNNLFCFQSISFDPMQPTRQLQRSPIPPISFSEEPGTSISNSPPLFCRFLRSQDIKVPKLSSDILQGCINVFVNSKFSHQGEFDG